MVICVCCKLDFNYYLVSVRSKFYCCPFHSVYLFFSSVETPTCSRACRKKDLVFCTNSKYVFDSNIGLRLLLDVKIIYIFSVKRKWQSRLLGGEATNSAPPFMVIFVCLKLDFIYGLVSVRSKIQCPHFHSVQFFSSLETPTCVRAYRRNYFVFVLTPNMCLIQISD